MAWPCDAKAHAERGTPVVFSSGTFKVDTPAAWFVGCLLLWRMAIEYSEIGTKVGVGKLDRHRKRIPAQVVRFLFYDPDKTSPVLTSHSARNGPSLRAAEVAC